MYFGHKKNLNKQDYLIICGDAGIVWDCQNQDAQVQSILQDLPVTTLFVDGNHENFVALNEYPVEKWHGGKVHFICDDIIHLMRGQVYTIGTQTFFTFGGAHSVDWYQRTEGISWWKEEIPNHLEMQEGQDNLMKMNHKVCHIDATIICERDSHKGIIIGKQGSMLKKIGSTARFEIERLLDCKVNLKLWVKVQKNWRDSDYMMKNFGYREDEM